MSFVYRHAADRVFWQFFGRARVTTDEAARQVIYGAMPEIERTLDPDRAGVAVLVDLTAVRGRGVEMTA
jgi:hypothetical protein